MYTLGIDIGGTQLRAAFFDERFNMCDVCRLENSRACTPEQNLDRLIDFVRARGTEKGLEIARVGVGCPGPLDLRAGRILTPPNLFGWDNFEIVRYMRSRIGRPVALNNDANAAGLAEALLGGGRGCESVVYIGVSTGIGGAFVYRGELVNGAHANAAEWWNMIVNEDPLCHRNANPGSLNEMSSGSGLELHAAARFGRSVRAKELFEMFNAGDADAVELVEAAAEALAKGIANMAVAVDPEVFVIGGSVAIHNPRYVEMVEARAKKYLLAPEYLKIRSAAFGDDAGLLGAALLTRNMLSGNE